MKVYVVTYLDGEDGRPETEVYSRETAVAHARAAAQTNSRVREYGDMRTDAEALADFVVVRWATEKEVL